MTSVISYRKKQFHDVPSVHMAYIAAILARAGPRRIRWTREEVVVTATLYPDAVVARRSQERDDVG